MGDGSAGRHPRDGDVIRRRAADGSTAKLLAHSASGFRHVIQMRELISEVDAEVCDLRGLRELHPELYDAESYAASQPFGDVLRRTGGNGIVYGSVRRPGRHQPGGLPPLAAATGSAGRPF
jgi:hypothetical protein